MAKSNPSIISWDQSKEAYRLTEPDRPDENELKY